MEKKCFKCRKTKPLSEFYKHSQMGDGYLGKCKLCTKKDVRRRYYDPEARERIARYEHERNKTERRKAKRLEYQRTMRERYPGKYRARSKVANALRDGRIIKRPCEVCGVENVEAHHTDYRKPLDVQWLCREHHLLAENKQPYNL